MQLIEKPLTIPLSLFHLCHIQIGRLPVQFAGALGQVTQSIIWFTMWSTAQIRNMQWWKLGGEDFHLPITQRWPCQIQINGYKLTLYYWQKSLYNHCENLKTKVPLTYSTAKYFHSYKIWFLFIEIVLNAFTKILGV